MKHKLFFILVYVLIALPLIAGYQKIPLSNMPDYFFGKWYDSKGVWQWGVKYQNFRTANIFFDYELILKNDDGSYLCVFYHPKGSRVYEFTFLSKSVLEYRSLPNGKYKTLKKRG